MAPVIQQWVVVLCDPRTGVIESFGPYPEDEADVLRAWCTAELDPEDATGTVIATAVLRP